MKYMSRWTWVILSEELWSIIINNCQILTKYVRSLLLRYMALQNKYRSPILINTGCLEYFTVKLSCDTIWRHKSLTSYKHYVLIKTWPKTWSSCTDFHTIARRYTHKHTEHDIHVCKCIVYWLYERNISQLIVYIYEQINPLDLAWSNSL